jgi:ribosomal protein S17
MRRYFDQTLQQPMLLRVVVEDAVDETVVITVYRTSQINRYLRGVTQ